MVAKGQNPQHDFKDVAVANRELVRKLTEVMLKKNKDKGEEVTDSELVALDLLLDALSPHQYALVANVLRSQKLNPTIIFTSESPARTLFRDLLHEGNPRARPLTSSSWCRMD